MTLETKENLGAISEEQRRRQDLAKETVDRILKETPAQISTEMYARTVAFAAYEAGWNNKVARGVEGLQLAVKVIEGLSDPQAAPDSFYEALLKAVKGALNAVALKEEENEKDS